MPPFTGSQASPGDGTKHRFCDLRNGSLRPENHPLPPQVSLELKRAFHPGISAHPARGTTLACDAAVSRHSA